MLRGLFKILLIFFLIFWILHYLMRITRLLSPPQEKKKPFDFRFKWFKGDKGMQQTKPKKRFGKDDGEYVEYEELKD